MSELQAAIGTEQVDRLDEFNHRRTGISQRLRRELVDVEWLQAATIRDYVDHAFFWVPFEIDEEAIGLTGKEVWRRLKDLGVETRHRYNEPLYEQPVFVEHSGFNGEFPWSANPNEHRYEDLSLPNVESVVGRMIGLPNHPNLTDEEIEYVVEKILEFDATMGR